MMQGSVFLAKRILELGRFLRPVWIYALSTFSTQEKSMAAHPSVLAWGHKESDTTERLSTCAPFPQRDHFVMEINVKLLRVVHFPSVRDLGSSWPRASHTRHMRNSTQERLF